MKSRVEYGDWTINHALGCSHGCKYPCYAYLLKRRFGHIKDYSEWCKPRIVSNALELLDHELARLHKRIKSVQLCFATDPFMYQVPEMEELSIQIIDKINSYDIPCIVLTKGTLPLELSDLSSKNEYGITLVSLSEKFRSQFEPFAAPIAERIYALRRLSKTNKTWVSVEPYPTPNIIEQDLTELLKAVWFVNRIVFGRWNYSKLTAKSLNPDKFYADCVQTVKNFCQSSGISLHIKEGTINEIYKSRT